MLAILILGVGSAAALAVPLLVIVVIGIRQEPSTEELREQAPGFIAAFVRRLLGVYVRKLPSPLSLDQFDNDHASLITPPLVGPIDKANLK
jgi:hypothetical protein